MRDLSSVIRKVKSLINFGLSSGAGESVGAGSFATFQYTYDGKVCNLIVLNPYGMHSNIPAGVLSAILSVNADTSNRCAIGALAENPPSLEPGEVCMYLPGTAAIIKFKTDGNIDIVTGVDGTPGVLKLVGDLAVIGDVLCSNLVAEADISGGTVSSIGEVTANADSVPITLTGHDHLYTPGTGTPTQTGPGVG